MSALPVSARTRKRLIERGLDALTWLVLLVMLSPVIWLVLSSLQTDGNLARGTYDVLHPTFTAFRDMWSTVEFSRYLVNSVIICTAAAGLATAFASTAGYALARFRFRGARPFGFAADRHAAHPRVDVPAAGLPRVRVARAPHADHASSTRGRG